MSSMRKLPRRELLRHAVGFLPLIALIGSRARAAESCVDPASESLRVSLHYKIVGPGAAQSCATCGFFAANEKPSCGDCMIMSGPVDAAAHCDSWSAKT